MELFKATKDYSGAEGESFSVDASEFEYEVSITRESPGKKIAVSKAKRLGAATLAIFLPVCFLSVVLVLMMMWQGTILKQ